ncbi:MAG: metal ABC transporter permease [Acidobacteria bacterium]|nr:MAG: metal ABC transporter permease [Acidobacteriota bacterium]
MMDWLIDPFSHAFQLRALVAGSLAAVVFAVVGTWVVIRGMTFLGDALVHGVIPGIALAVLFDFNVLLGAVGAALVMIAGINFVHRQTEFSEDTGIGLLFAGMLSVGVILISTTPNASRTLTAILFGNVLAVSASDIAVLAAVAVVSVAGTMLLFRRLVALSFNERKAELLGLNPRATHAMLLVLITLAIVGSFQTVGTLLVFGLMVGPPATAALLVRRIPTMMITAGAIGVFSVVTGLVISYHADTSGSATMALIPIVLFFTVLGAKTVTTKQRSSETSVKNSAT